MWGQHNKFCKKIMKVFNSLNSSFRKAFKNASKKGNVRFTIEGIKDNADSMYPMVEISNKHVTYYSVEKQSDVCITDMNIKAIIY